MQHPQRRVVFRSVVPGFSSQQHTTTWLVPFPLFYGTPAFSSYFTHLSYANSSIATIILLLKSGIVEIFSTSLNGKTFDENLTLKSPPACQVLEEPTALK